MMILPSQNPLFIDDPHLRQTYNRFEIEALSDTEWLWQDLVIEGEPEKSLETAKTEWRRMHYHGLAHFFTEIALCYAYWQALIQCRVDHTQTLLFHGNNVVLRIVSCWDRMGFCLNDRFDLNHREDEIYFEPIISQLCSDPQITMVNRKHIRKLKEIFDKDGRARTWRDKYLHRYGEYFRIEGSSRGTESLSFPWSKEDRARIVAELQQILPSSFASLKRGMRVCAELFA